MIDFIDEEYGYQYHLLDTSLSPLELRARFLTEFDPCSLHVANLDRFGALRNLDTYARGWELGCNEVEISQANNRATVRLHIHGWDDSYIEIKFSDGWKRYSLPILN